MTGIRSMSLLTLIDDDLALEMSGANELLSVYDGEVRYKNCPAA